MTLGNRMMISKMVMKLAPVNRPITPPAIMHKLHYISITSYFSLEHLSPKLATVSAKVTLRSFSILVAESLSM